MRCVSTASLTCAHAEPPQELLRSQQSVFMLCSLVHQYTLTTYSNEAIASKGSFTYMAQMHTALTVTYYCHVQGLNPRWQRIA